MNLASRSAHPLDSDLLPSLEDLKHLPPLVLGMFGASMVAFGVVAIQQSAKMLSAKSPTDFIRTLTVRPPARFTR